ncbi:MAG: hypothetical protein AAF542_24405 [Pseudomonadota bacterium]
MIYVENLNNSGSGSLREALTTPGPRTVLFKVGGTIELSSPIQIYEPYLTIDGRTAPGDGITIKSKPGTMVEAPIIVRVSEVIIRYIRFRPGPNKVADACCGDALSIGHYRNVIRNVIIDHCSFSWAQDENVETYYNTSNITIQWSIISESLNQVLSGNDPSQNVDRTGKATLLGSTSEDFKISFHHNLLAMNPGRNARFAGDAVNNQGLAEFVNNYVYGWTSFGLELGQYTYGAFNLLPTNVINNYFESIPATSDQRCPGGIDAGMTLRPVVYVAGNYNDTVTNTAKTLTNPGSEDPWKFMCLGGGNPFMTIQSNKGYQKSTPNRRSQPAITVQPGESIRNPILAHAGVSLPKRDAVDNRVVQLVRSKQGKIINDPAAVGGYPTLQSGSVPKDSDGDGLPDTFETSVGLNPNSAGDGTQDMDGDGYTNLEEYLNNI